MEPLATAAAPPAPLGPGSARRHGRHQRDDPGQGRAHRPSSPRDGFRDNARNPAPAPAAQLQHPHPEADDRRSAPPALGDRGRAVPDGDGADGAGTRGSRPRPSRVRCGGGGGRRHLSSCMPIWARAMNSRSQPGWQAALPGGFICPSHAILAEFRNYDGSPTPVLNAGPRPVMGRYLTQLQTRGEISGSAAGRTSCNPTAASPRRGRPAGKAGAHAGLRPRRGGDRRGSNCCLAASVSATYHLRCRRHLDSCLPGAGRPEPPSRGRREVPWLAGALPDDRLHSVGAGGGSSIGGCGRLPPGRAGSAGAHPRAAALRSRRHARRP